MKVVANAANLGTSLVGADGGASIEVLSCRSYSSAQRAKFVRELAVRVQRCLLPNESLGHLTKHGWRNRSIVEPRSYDSAALVRFGLAGQESVACTEFDNRPGVGGIDELGIAASSFGHARALSEALLRPGPRFKHGGVPLPVERSPAELSQGEVAQPKTFAEAHEQLSKRRIQWGQ